MTLAESCASTAAALASPTNQHLCTGLAGCIHCEAILRLDQAAERLNAVKNFIEWLQQEPEHD